MKSMFLKELGCLSWNTDDSVTSSEERRIYSAVLRNKGRAPTGISVAGKCDRIVVADVAFGSVHSWNSSHKETRCFVEPGDELLTINGTTGDTYHCQEEISKPGVVTLTLRKPRRHIVEITKDNTCTIGLNLSNMFITSIDPRGLVQKWLNVNPGVSIEPKDFVVEVNGYRNTVLKEIELANKDVISMTVCHYEYALDIVPENACVCRCAP